MMNATITEQTADATTGRGANIALWTLQVLTALFFAVASAFPKLTAHPSAAEGFDKIGYGDWFMYLIGGLELAGAIALVVPLLAGVSAVAFIGLMIGAFTYQVTVFDGEYWITPLIVMAVMAIIAWGRRAQTAWLVTLLRSVVSG